MKAVIFLWCVGFFLAMGASQTAAAPVRDPHWVAAWSSAAVTPATAAGGNGFVAYDNVTTRQFVRLSTGGARFRVLLTNQLGETPLHVGDARVAFCDDSRALDPQHGSRLLFGGQSDVTIPAGSPIYSDPVDLPVQAMQCLAISVYFPDRAHPAGRSMRMIVSANGDHSDEARFPDEQTVRGTGVVSRVDVESASGARVVIALGDSITAGAGSTRGANRDWPGQLAQRVAGSGWSVINAGIEGNRLIHGDAGEGPQALSRLDRDVLAIPGAAVVVLLEGVNDIGFSAQEQYQNEAVSAGDIIAADRQIIARCHALGLRVLGGTILPFHGAAYWTEEGEKKRQDVNFFIRNDKAFDGIIDFDAALRNPADPSSLRSVYDYGDHLHLNDAGYAAMADSAAKFFN
jgi:lysophospholipase L1-like esterase